ncbi:Uncharacterised protein [uncultured archaeon]|nr:Uncharacterised protein [uncultured archaeon]
MIADSCHDLLLRENLDPGEIRVYLVGGRVTGKRLREDSDIDVIIAVQDVSKSLGANADSFMKALGGNDHMHAWDIKLGLMADLVGEPTVNKPGIVPMFCKELGIANKFHVLEFGDPFFKELNKPGDYLLVGARAKRAGEDLKARRLA